MAMPRPNEANLPPSPRNSLVSPRQTPRGAAKSLTSFRSLLLDCHTNIMRQLDREIFELDKGLKEDGKALNVPFRDSFVPLQPSDEPRSLEPRYSAHSGELCLSRAASLTVPEISEEGSEEEKGEKHVHVASFPTFSEVEEKRKKNMVWIQKQSRVTMVKEAYEAPATVMTKHQQKKVQKDAKQRFKSGAVFAHLSSDRIEEDVTDAALEKFGSTMVLDEEQSCVQRLAQNRWFERAALLLTLSNVIYISLDVEFNYSGLASESSTGFIVMDNIFCCLFLAELLVRFLAFPSRWLALRDPAFVFDSILVAMMIVEAWIMPLLNFIKSGDSSDVAASTILRIARVMRILRTARIAKLVQGPS